MTERALNINIGILGHVDSGKTTLCKVLSTTASTASFDKNPQSKERGITLDLGFSAFYADAPKKISKDGFNKIQYTLVDCPGHASLMKTVIGGAQIIDFMILVVDVIKGIQTQTAECIVIGEITSENLIVVLNKVDLLEGNKKKEIKKASALIKGVLSKTKFKNAPIIEVSANPKQGKPQGMDLLVKQIIEFTHSPKTKQNSTKPLLFAIDHCFPLKGKGTILTGTILSGKMEINQSIELPLIGEKRKVKSIQVFRKPVNVAYKGDRVGVCVTNLKSSKFERGYASDPGVIQTLSKAILKVKKIRYFKSSITNKSHFHISIGHSTVMCQAKFFSHKPKDKNQLSLDYRDFDISKSYNQEDELKTSKNKQFYAQVEFKTPITSPVYAKFIASRLDSDINKNTIRLAFHGIILKNIENVESKLVVVKQKERTAMVDRIVGENVLIGKDLIKKGQSLNKYMGKKIKLGEKGPTGIITSSFGSSGKFKVTFDHGVGLKKIKEKKLILKFKVNIFDKQRKWIQ